MFAKVQRLWREEPTLQVGDLAVAQVDPDLAALADLDRQRHIEPYLNAVATAISVMTGEPISVGDQGRRIRAVGHMLGEITEWGWAEAPARRLVFAGDIPRQPRPLPRYIPVDADRRLNETLQHSSYRLAADALLLARACGLRIGELLTSSWTVCTRFHGMAVG